MTIINLTSHEVTLFDPEGKKILARIPPSGKEARVKVKQEIVSYIPLPSPDMACYGPGEDATEATFRDRIPVVRSHFGEVYGLPEPQEGVVYIVSYPVLQAMAGKRNDLVAPDTTPNGVVKDPEGWVIGVKRFQIL